MKKYILKYPIYNCIDFPAGTVVKLIDHGHYNFIVVSGRLKGEKGLAVDGISTHLCEYSAENKKKISISLAEAKRLEMALKRAYMMFSKIPSPKKSEIRKQINECYTP